MVARPARGGARLRRSAPPVLPIFLLPFLIAAGRPCHTCILHHVHQKYVSQYHAPRVCDVRSVPRGRAHGIRVRPLPARSYE
eukprot:6189006-Pleurochrysis_carterae.AAC.1